MLSVVIPAYNEARVIGRLLQELQHEAASGEFDVVVVSNGSTDDTAARARAFPGVRVIEFDEGSKHLAMLAGDEVARGFPRIYVDADVVIDAPALRALAATLTGQGVHAAAPRRVLDFTGASWFVRAHYRVWERLPAVRDGLFGRGVIGVSEVGHARIADRPAILADDLYVHAQFAPAERRIVAAAQSTVRTPRTAADLIRRRTRAAQGNAEIVENDRTASSTASSLRALPGLLRADPRLAPDVLVFAAVTGVGRLRGRRMRERGVRTWLRDDSSRA